MLIEAVGLSLEPLMITVSAKYDLDSNEKSSSAVAVLLVYPGNDPSHVDLLCRAVPRPRDVSIYRYLQRRVLCDGHRVDRWIR